MGARVGDVVGYFVGDAVGSLVGFCVGSDEGRRVLWCDGAGLRRSEDDARQKIKIIRINTQKKHMVCHRESPKSCEEGEGLFDAPNVKVELYNVAQRARARRRGVTNKNATE